MKTLFLLALTYISTGAFAQGEITDMIIFGDETSGISHDVAWTRSDIIVGGLNESARNGIVNN